MPNLKLTHYDVLGISETATLEEIRVAYKKKARETHPDKHKDDPNAEENFKQVSTAHIVLSDTVKRADYDLELKHERDGLRHAASSSRPAPAPTAAAKPAAPTPAAPTPKPAASTVKKDEKESRFAYTRTPSQERSRFAATSHASKPSLFRNVPIASPRTFVFQANDLYAMLIRIELQRQLQLQLLMFLMLNDMLRARQFQHHQGSCRVESGFQHDDFVRPTVRVRF